MGYDHNYVLRGLASSNGHVSSDGLQPVARVFDPHSGRHMTVRTDQKGVQFYTGNYLDGKLHRSRASEGYARHHGFCLETQAFPDSVNQEHFPNTILRPGETYTHTTTHTFGASDLPPTGPF